MRKTLFAVLAVVQVAVVGGLAWLFLRSGPAPRATPVMPPPMVADPSPTLAVRGDTVLHESPADGRADPAAGPHVELAHADRATVDPAPPLPPVAARPPADGPPVAPAAVPGKPRLAILPFKVDRPTPDQVGEQMADYFAGQITTDTYDLFERGQLSGPGVARPGCSRRACSTRPRRGSWPGRSSCWSATCRRRGASTASSSSTPG